MTRDQIIREEFERWYSYQGSRPRAIARSATNLGGYHLSQTECAWITWRAAWTIATGYSE